MMKAVPGTGCGLGGLWYKVVLTCMLFWRLIKHPTTFKKGDLACGCALMVLPSCVTASESEASLKLINQKPLICLWSVNKLAQCTSGIDWEPELAQLRRGCRARNRVKG